MGNGFKNSCCKPKKGQYDEGELKNPSRRKDEQGYFVQTGQLSGQISSQHNHMVKKRLVYIFKQKDKINMESCAKITKESSKQQVASNFDFFDIKPQFQLQYDESDSDQDSESEQQEKEMLIQQLGLKLGDKQNFQTLQSFKTLQQFGQQQFLPSQQSSLYSILQQQSDPNLKLQDRVFKDSTEIKKRKLQKQQFLNF